jgi:Zn-dependent protease
MEFTNKEIKKILIGSLIAGIVFSFNEWGTTKFDLMVGIINLLKATIIVSIVYITHSFSQKFAAKKSACDVEFNLISMNKIPGKNVDIPSMLRPIGPIITLLITLISNGKLFFIMLASFEITYSKEKRVGHQWSHLKDYEEATIALAGPLSNIVLIIIFKLLNPIASAFFNKAVFITSALLIFHLLPLPKFDGIKIFFGSKFLYPFVIILATIIIVLIHWLNPITSAGIAILISTMLATFYFYKVNS